jgi:GxxExxY protein
MHEDEISHAIIGAAIEVHREVGPGLIEKPYEEAMCHELHLRGLPLLRQRPVPFIYKGVQLSVDLRTDLIVASKVVVDLKAKDQVTAIDKRGGGAQTKNAEGNGLPEASRGTQWTGRIVPLFLHPPVIDW